MMAKMFYTLDETMAALGKDQDSIKRLTDDGRLRRFQDGPRVMYKADQVENLKRELESGGGDEIPLGPSDTGAPIGLVDSRSGSGPAISLGDSHAGGSSPGASMKEDTALAADLGLSGSIGLSQSIGLSNSIGLASSTPGGSVAGGSVAGGSLGGIPSPGRPGGGSGLSGLSNSGSGSRGGINILEDEGNADPAAQTAITPSGDLSASEMGSGSGLLDLTRESDNTSLGAVLDEIPGGSGGSMAGGSLAGGSLAGSLGGGSLAGSFAGGSLAGGSLVGTRGAETIGATSGGSSISSVSSVGRVITPPTYVEARDAMAPAFAGAAACATLFAIFGIFALAAGTLGVKSAAVAKVGSIANGNFLIVLLIGAGLAALGFIIGLVAGKVRA